jgi:serine phosphatase RsbU (regulator of sigma subunit)
MNLATDRIVANPPLGPTGNLGIFRVLAESRSAGGSGGGDFYAYQLRGPHSIYVVIGDVCGRGEEAAQLLPNILLRLEELSPFAGPPSLLLERLNTKLGGELPADRFVTGAAYEIDARAGTLTVANAGHVPAMLRPAHGVVSVIGRASGPPLGILPEGNYVDERYPFAVGDVVVLMSDGILEVVETDLTSMLTLTALVGGSPPGSRGVHRSLLKRLDEYPAERRTDDITLISLEALAFADAMKTEGLEQALGSCAF